MESGEQLPPLGPDRADPASAIGRPGFQSPVTDADIAREKARARALRATTWWKRRLAAGRCGYCGRPTPPGALTMDHRLPLVRGGRSTRGNVVPACKACNTAKRYLLPAEWEADLARRGKKPWTSEPEQS